MDLIFWRHAEAIELELVGDDMTRTLTSKGEKQAARMAAWLDRQLPEGTKVWSSPAARAEQTARALSRKFKTTAALAPLSSTDRLFELVQWPHGKGCVLLVGHQPSFGFAISQLLGMKEPECPIKKGAVWWLRYREREIGAQTVLLTVQTPELL